MMYRRCCCRNAGAWTPIVYTCDTVYMSPIASDVFTYL